MKAAVKSKAMKATKAIPAEAGQVTSLAQTAADSDDVGPEKAMKAAIKAKAMKAMKAAMKAKAKSKAMKAKAKTKPSHEGCHESKSQNRAIKTVEYLAVHIQQNLRLQQQQMQQQHQEQQHQGRVVEKLMSTVSSLVLMEQESQQRMRRLMNILQAMHQQQQEGRAEDTDADCESTGAL